MSKRSLRHRSAGVVLLIVMCCLAIATTLIVGWARVAMFENRQARSAEDHLQAGWLAESALQRAAAQLLANSEYQGETWRVTAADLGRPAATRQPGSTVAAGTPAEAAAPETAAEEKKPDDGPAPPASGKTVSATTGGGDASTAAPVIGVALITVEPVPDRAGARMVRVRADFPAAGEAGTATGIATNRISRQIVFDLSEPTAKSSPENPGQSGGNEP